jgi:hypothetical protein
MEHIMEPQLNVNVVLEGKILLANVNQAKANEFFSNLAEEERRNAKIVPVAPDGRFLLHD